LVNFKPQILGPSGVKDELSSMAKALPFSVLLCASSSGLPRWQVCGGDRNRGMARRARCRGRSVGVARMTKGENGVKLVVEDGKEKEEEPFLLRIGVSLVTELLRVFESFGR